MNEANYTIVAEQDNEIAGFITAFDRTHKYTSVNYLYFKERYEEFLYIDRIAVYAKFRRQKIGETLYKVLISQCKNKYAILGCEVNTQPPNPISLAFHLKVGFEQLEEKEILKNNKVAYLGMRFSK